MKKNIIDYNTGKLLQEVGWQEIKDPNSSTKRYQLSLEYRGFVAIAEVKDTAEDGYGIYGLEVINSYTSSKSINYTTISRATEALDHVENLLLKLEIPFVGEEETFEFVTNDEEKRKINSTIRDKYQLNELEELEETLIDIEIEHHNY